MARGGFAPSNIHCAPTSGGTLRKHTMNTAALCQPVQCRLSWGIRTASKRSPTMLDFLLPAKRNRYLPPHAPWSLNFKPSHVTHKGHRWMPKTDRIYHRWDFHPPHYPAVCGYINWPPAPSVDTFRTRKCQKKWLLLKANNFLLYGDLKHNVSRHVVARNGLFYSSDFHPAT